MCVYDADGKKYLDFCAGWGVVSTGYNHPQIIEAVCNQMKELSFTSLCSMISSKSVELAEMLIKATPGDFEKKVWFGHSGSDANEFVAKILPLASGKPRLLTFVGSYHGQTMGSYAMSGHPAQGQFIGGGNVTKIQYPYCYRCSFGRKQDECGLFCLKYIEEYIFKAVAYPDQVGGVIVEAIQCDGGDVVPPDGYLEGLQEICRKNNIYFLIDEVKIGIGRTGKLFGFENWNLEPDAIIIGKPIGSGQPLSAVVGRKEIMDAGIGMHLFTTAGNPVACASGIETLKIVEREKLLQNAQINGLYFKKKLVELSEKYKIIGDVRGKGLVLGVEIVKDITTKEPDADLAAMISYRAFELGLIFYCVGIFSNVLEFTPPLIIKKEDIDEGIRILSLAIEDVLEGRFDSNKLSCFAGWSI